MSTGTLDRRARKKLATYKALAAAARELTLERGLEQVTVEEIAAAADVSTRTFFNYYRCKEEAVVGVEPAVLEAAADRLRQRPDSEDPWTALLEVFVADGDTEVARRWRIRTELLERYPQLLPRHMAGIVAMERAFTEAVADRLGSEPGDPYPRLVVATAVAAIRTTLEWWVSNGQPGSLADSIRASFALLGDGIPRSRDPYEK